LLYIGRHLLDGLLGPQSSFPHIIYLSEEFGQVSLGCLDPLDAFDIGNGLLLDEIRDVLIEFVLVRLEGLRGLGDGGEG